MTVWFIVMLKFHEILPSNESLFDFTERESSVLKKNSFWKGDYPNRSKQRSVSHSHKIDLVSIWSTAYVSTKWCRKRDTVFDGWDSCFGNREWSICFARTEIQIDILPYISASMIFSPTKLPFAFAFADRGARNVAVFR